jgi:hypothetical protein
LALVERKALILALMVVLVQIVILLELALCAGVVILVVQEEVTLVLVAVMEEMDSDQVAVAAQAVILEQVAPVETEHFPLEPQDQAVAVVVEVVVDFNVYMVVVKDISLEQVLVVA